MGVIKPENLTEEEWEKIIRDAGFRRIKARDHRGNFKQAFDKHWEEKNKPIKKKEVVESRDITEPLDPYKEVTS